MTVINPRDRVRRRCEGTPPMTRRRRQVLTGLLAMALTIVGGAIAIHSSGTTPAAATAAGELPALASAHMRALPGNDGLEGPAGGAEQAYLERAYPAGTISVTQMDRARASYTASKGRPFPTGKGQKGTWLSVGPSEALYPSSQFLTQFNYVPNAYVAGGRTTSIAIADTCVPRNCRMYATPAGGGVWRTSDALAATPKWEYLGGPLGINAAGTVTIDRND